MKQHIRTGIVQIIYLKEKLKLDDGYQSTINFV